MSINPADINTVRVGQLPTAIFSGTDNIPHEVGTDLKRGTITDLATYIIGLIELSEGLSFLPISVTDGQTLPTTTVNEWFLAGKGTYYQSGGYPAIICTDELSVIISNGTFWSLGVSIPIIAPPMVSQTVNAGVFNYSPSEDAVRSAIDAIVVDNYTKIVFVNDTDPSTATIFDDVNPPVTNDTLLDSDVNNLYIGTDSSTWVWNGTIYTTKVVPESSNFYINGTTVDAGSNKNQPINRELPISVMTIGDKGVSVWKNTLSFWKYITGVAKFVNVYFDNITNSYDVQFPNKAAGTETFAMMSDIVASSLAIIPIETGTSFTLANGDVGKLFIITTSCTVTIPNGLMSGFNAIFATVTGVTLTIALGGSVVLFNNAGLTMAEKLSFVLQARTTANNYITEGNL